jgi:hypothetical protein
MNRPTNILMISAFSLSVIYAAASSRSVPPENIKKETSESENPNKTFRLRFLTKAGRITSDAPRPNYD